MSPIFFWRYGCSIYGKPKGKPTSLKPSDGIPAPADKELEGSPWCCCRCICPVRRSPQNFINGEKYLWKTSSIWGEQEYYVFVQSNKQTTDILDQGFGIVCCPSVSAMLPKRWPLSGGRTTFSNLMIWLTSSHSFGSNHVSYFLKKYLPVQGQFLWNQHIQRRKTRSKLDAFKGIFFRYPTTWSW